MKKNVCHQTVDRGDGDDLLLIDSINFCFCLYKIIEHKN